MQIIIRSIPRARGRDRRAGMAMRIEWGVAVYAIPTTTLIPSGESRIPQVLKYGDYSVTVRYDVQGMTHSVTGCVQYIHKSHWEIGTMGWKD